MDNSVFLAGVHLALFLALPLVPARSHHDADPTENTADINAAPPPVCPAYWQGDLSSDQLRAASLIGRNAVT